MRITIDIGEPILREINAIRKRDGRSIGVVISELLADALARRRPSRSAGTSRPMKTLVDLTDNEAVDAADQS
jgi:hypothetical protein